MAAGRLTEADLDAALTNTLRMRFLTGQFDPPSANPWAGLPVSTVNSKEHRKLARQVVHKGGRTRCARCCISAKLLSFLSCKTVRKGEGGSRPRSNSKPVHALCIRLLLVAAAGTVLLQNNPVPGTSTPILPLDKGALSKVCITGPLADSAEHMMGNYYGKFDESAALTPKKAIKEELGE